MAAQCGGHRLFQLSIHAALLTTVAALVSALARLLLPLARLLTATLLTAAALLTTLLAALLLLAGTRLVLVGILVRHTCHSLRVCPPVELTPKFREGFGRNPIRRLI
jgi:hypothetical protein